MTKAPRHQSQKADEKRDSRDRYTILIGSRPKRGLTPKEALKRWSDPTAYAELIVISGQDEPPGLHDPDVTREPTYKQKREALETARIRKLLDREIYCSGIGPSGSREIIDPNLWECLEIFDDVDEAIGDDWKFKKIELFELAELPTNISSLPDWLGKDLVHFGHDEDFRHVTLGEIRFVFGSKQAAVVKALFLSWSGKNPWRNGKKLLDDAGSQQAKPVDLFKSKRHWRELIEGDDSGMYRLRFTHHSD